MMITIYVNFCYLQIKMAKMCKFVQLWSILSGKIYFFLVNNSGFGKAKTWPCLVFLCKLILLLMLNSSNMVIKFVKINLKIALRATGKNNCMLSARLLWPSFKFWNNNYSKDIWCFLSFSLNLTKFQPDPNSKHSY